MADLPSCSNGAGHIQQFPWCGLPRLYEMTTSKESMKRCNCTSKKCKKFIGGLVVNGKPSYLTMRICSGGTSSKLQKEIYAAHHKLLEGRMKERAKKKPWHIKNFHFHQSLLHQNKSIHVPSYIHNKELAKEIYGELEKKYRVGPEYPFTWFVLPTEQIIDYTGETNIIKLEKINNTGETEVCSHGVDANCCSSLVSSPVVCRRLL